MKVDITASLLRKLLAIVWPLLRAAMDAWIKGESGESDEPDKADAKA